MKLFWLCAGTLVIMLISMAICIAASAQTVTCTEVQAPTVRAVGNRAIICPSETGKVYIVATWEDGTSVPVVVTSQKSVHIPFEFVGVCGTGTVKLRQEDSGTPVDTSIEVTIPTIFKPCPPESRQRTNYE